MSRSAILGRGRASRRNCAGRHPGRLDFWRVRLYLADQACRVASIAPAMNLERRRPSDTKAASQHSVARLRSRRRCCCGRIRLLNEPPRLRHWPRSRARLLQRAQEGAEGMIGRYDARPHASAIAAVRGSGDRVVRRSSRRRSTMIRRSIVLLVLATMVGVAACASMSVHPREIFDDVPAKIDPGARYLFHMHGWVVERYGPAGAVSTGYWWRWTVEAFADREFVVISEARRADTDVQAYALTVARQVARLRAAGVPSDHITVTGMSNGGSSRS